MPQATVASYFFGKIHRNQWQVLVFFLEAVGFLGCAFISNANFNLLQMRVLLTYCSPNQRFVEVVQIGAFFHDLCRWELKSVELVIGIEMENNPCSHLVGGKKNNFKNDFENKRVEFSEILFSMLLSVALK